MPLDRLRTPPKGDRKDIRLDNLKTVDGLAHGARYRNSYLCFPTEFLHRPGRGIKQPTPRRPPKLSLSDLECIKVLEQGGSSKILLSIRQKVIRSLEPETVPLASKPPDRDVERVILSRVAWNPFVANIIDVFHDTRSIYTLLEDIPCGTVRSLIQDQGPFDATAATFYYANIASALSFLQDYDIVHRNLNPDTILVGADGYLCLSDFTKATIPADDQGFWYWNLPGILAYTAPESINPSIMTPLSYGSTVDWWSSGCIFFELLTGEPAFLGVTDRATLGRIFSGRVNWPVAARIGKNIKAVIESLLALHPYDRLGFKGFEEIFQHPFFNLVDWNMVENRLYIAPHVPPSPDAAGKWHKYPLPRQSQIPGLRVAMPSILLAHDERFAFHTQ